MNAIDSLKLPDWPSSRAVAIACATLLVLAYSVANAQQDQALAPAAANEAPPPIPADQLDSLVAPIALYPDPLLAQTLAASTYPLEVIQLEQWMANNKYLKDNALADAVAKQPWDPSVQAMAAFPDVVQRMAGNIQWTTDLGNAFLAQQADVMDAVQRMRAKAQGKGNLETNAQQNVETQTVEGGKQVIVVEQANPDVVYVPSYDPQVVYGAPPPAYPYYPYSYPGYYAGMGLAFGTGLVLGGAWANNNWGNCNWNHGDININNNNNFNRNVNRGQGNTWQHNAQHRGNAPYGNRQTANKYGGTARGQGGRPGTGNVASSNRFGGATGVGNIGTTNRASGGAGGGNLTAGSRPSAGAQNFAAGNRPGGASGAGNISGGNRPGGGAGTSRAGGGASTMPAIRPTGAAGGNSIGNRTVSSGSGFGSSSNAFGGGGFGGNSARSASSRGGASMGGGGFSRGGGGGGRGGGGRRR